jgi:hypothetical protein
MSDSFTSAPAEVPSPLLVAAWERLGLLPTERVPLWAAYWIAGGLDGPALVYLAGLHGDDPRDVHDALPDGLADCGVKMLDSDVAAATVAFIHVARLHVAALTGPQWVLSQVGQIVAGSGYSLSVIDLPLGGLFDVDDESGAGWGRSDEELAQLVLGACEEQLRNGFAPQAGPARLPSSS